VTKNIAAGEIKVPGLQMENRDGVGNGKIMRAIIDKNVMTVTDLVIGKNDPISKDREILFNPHGLGCLKEVGIPKRGSSDAFKFYARNLRKVSQHLLRRVNRGGVIIEIGS